MADAKHPGKASHPSQASSQPASPQGPSAAKPQIPLALLLAGGGGFAIGLLLGLTIAGLRSDPSPQQTKLLDKQSNSLDKQAEQLAELSNTLVDLKAEGARLSRTYVEDTPKRTVPQREPTPSKTENPLAQPQRIPAPENVRSQPEAIPSPRWPVRSYPVRRMQSGYVRIRIMEVVVGHVPLWNEVMQMEKKSDKEYLMIRLELENASKLKSIPYRSWMSKFASAMDYDASLTDDAGKRYRLIGPGLGLPVSGAQLSVNIYPSKMIRDVLVFEAPAERAKQLRLTLSAKAFGENGEILFKIPMSLVAFE